MGRVREAILTQDPGAVHKPTDSSTPVYYPFETSLASHKPQKLGLEWIEQNILDCPYEALQNRTVTHDTNSAVATSPQSISNITIQPNYTSGLNSDQNNYYNMVLCWLMPVYKYQL